MTSPNRSAVIDRLATAISSITSTRPIRIAIDGRTASGKTTLADELSSSIVATGRRVIRTSVDGFHRPKAERYARGRYSPDGYYYNARDLAAINALLLSPLGPSGNREYRTASFDLVKDEPIEQAPQTATTDAILIVGGTFLQRPELVKNWDLTIFVETSEMASERRGIARDTPLLGGLDAARQLYVARYQPAYRLYESICYPATCADAIFNNEDVQAPILIVKPSGRFAQIVDGLCDFTLNSSGRNG